MIGKDHSNRCARNRLICNIGDRFLEERILFYKDVPYGLVCGKSPYGFNCFLEKAGFLVVIILTMNCFSTLFIRGPRLICIGVSAGLIPVWHVGQKFTSILDKLNFNWVTEVSGYYVAAIVM